MALRYEYGDKTIQDFVHLFDDGQLNLEPGFQRSSVWVPKDRRKLIESIFQNYPMPSVFLYKNTDSDGKLVYDVIDGKQRLESILMFQGAGRFRGWRFPVRTRLDANKPIEEWNWNRVRQRGHEHRVMGYKIQTVEVSGELADIIDLFVRINSTGKRLTSAEKRHARYYHTDFLRHAGRLAQRAKSYFLKNRVLSRGQMSRMKDVELVCELLASIHVNSPIDKKKALDSIIAGKSIDGRSLQRCMREFVHTLNLVRRMFPNLRTTRFANVVDYYSLFMLVHEMAQQGCILLDRSRNRQAERLLIWLSNGVDVVRQKLRRAEGASADQRLFADYLLTVKGDTDSKATRTRRADILRQVFGSIFDKKDHRRTFTPEQRRLIWHSDVARRCSNRSCDEVLTWDNFTIDHIKAHARGGRTEPANAQVLCRSCNSRKGTGYRSARVTGNGRR